MSHVPTLEPSLASEDVRDVYSDFQRRMGFPSAPNFITTQGHSPSAARGTWGLVHNVLVGGLLPRTLKEMLFSAISKDRACRYCEAAHLACCRMLGVDSRTLEQLVTNLDSVSPEKARDIIQFGVKCARDPQSLDSADYDRLRHHGLTLSEIVEVVSMSALAVYANIIADATGMPPDAMFNEF